MANVRTHLGVAVGDGLVARFGDAVVLVAETAQYPDGTEELLHAVEVVASAGGSPGAGIAARLAAIVAGREPGLVPPFGVVAPLEDAYVILLHGSVSAEITSPRGVERLSGQQAVTWVDHRQEPPMDLLRVGYGAGPVEVDPRSDLRAGVVPGRGFVMTPFTPVGERAVDRARPARAGASQAGAAQDPAGSDEVSPEAPPGAAPPEEAEPLLAGQPEAAEPEAAELAVAAGPRAAQAAAAEPEAAEPEAAELAVAAGPEAAELAVAAGPEAAQAVAGEPDEAPPEAAEPALATEPATEAQRATAVPDGDAQPASGGLATEAKRAMAEAAPAEPAPADPDWFLGDDFGKPQRSVRSSELFAGPIGYLVAADGMRLPLDRAYVLGREPEADPAVRAGAATPIKLADEENLISRVQSYIAVDGGRVSLKDAASANGTYCAAPGALAWTPVGTDPVVLPPTWSIRVGNLVFTYVAAEAAP